MGETSDPSDEEMVRRIRAGDEAAAAVLFDRHLPRLRADARRRLPAALRGKLGASDVVQETFVAAYVRLGAFEDRGDGSFGRWLRGVLANRIAYEARQFAAEKRDARREVRMRTTQHAGHVARGRSPGTQAAAREDAASLRRAIGGLADDHATVIRLVHLEGLSLVEAAGRMDRSPDAVRMLYSRALAKLSEKLVKKAR